MIGTRRAALLDWHESHPRTSRDCVTPRRRAASRVEFEGRQPCACGAIKEEQSTPNQNSANYQNLENRKSFIFLICMCGCAVMSPCSCGAARMIPTLCPRPPRDTNPWHTLTHCECRTVGLWSNKRACHHNLQNETANNVGDLGSLPSTSTLLFKVVTLRRRLTAQFQAAGLTHVPGP